MSLNRIWTPSPNYNSGRSRTQILCVHTTEGATTIASIMNYCASSSAGVSYQVAFDDTPGTIGEMVRPGDRPWAAMSANDWGEHGVCCGFVAWSTDEWLSHATLLDNCAAWLAEESARTGIPLVKISGADITAGRAGVCGHWDTSQAGSGSDHTDPEPNFPWDHVLTLAGGGVPDTRPPAPVPPTGPGGSGAPPWPGVYLVDTTAHESAATWQAQMVARGWVLDVDGVYGPDSAEVCAAFQQEKGLAVDGVVGPDTWAATWTAPVT